MAKIAVLPPELVNKIAAGEVVERPASVLKELLENSLDAGARQITVEAEDGGKKSIRVGDDGTGMTAGELELAFTPHATSKIACEDDLYAVRTMGFRGEALASIASVSRIEAISRTREALAGARLVIEGGKRQAVTPVAAGPGTTITVRHLFFNTPARRKFLRSTQTELGHLVEQFTRIALPHPAVGFTLVHNGRVVYELSPEQSLRERIGMLFGEEHAADLLSIRRAEHGVEVGGFIAPPSRSRPNAQGIYVFLNGRCIRDRFISHAIREAYRGLLDAQRQPVVYLFLRVPPEAVDVNVHPAKAEVRFAEANLIHSQVLAAIRDKLLRTDLSVPLRGTEPRPDEATGKAPSPQEGTDQRRERVRQAMADFFRHAQTGASSAPPRRTGGARLSSASPSSASPRSPSPSPSSSLSSSSSPSSVLPSSPPFLQPTPSSESPSSESSSSESSPSPSREAPSSLSSPPSRLRSAPPRPPHLPSAPVAPGRSDPAAAPRPFMQVHNTYLVAESEDGLLIIDQHALHERIIYEQMYRQLQAGPLPSQRCLIPEVVEVTVRQLAVLHEAADLLVALGIVVEPFGPNAVAVQGYPALLDKLNPAAFLSDLLDLLTERHGQVSREELVHEVLDMLACKAAVKAGEPLTAEEIQALLAQRETVERSGNCPHGRPTTLRLSIGQLEKEFKRT